MFIVKTSLNSIFTNDLKRKDFFRKIFIVTDLVSLIFQPVIFDQISMLCAFIFHYYILSFQNKVYPD